MMKRQFVLFVACGVLATALACGDKSSSPAAPSPAGGAGSDVGATADGTTLKVTAPTLVSPANGSTLADSQCGVDGRRLGRQVRERRRPSPIDSRSC